MGKTNKSSRIEKAQDDLNAGKITLEQYEAIVDDKTAKE